MLAAFMFIACFAAGVSYYLDIDSKRKDWNAAQADVKAVQQTLLNLGTQVENACKNSEEAEAEASGIQKMMTSKGELKAAVDELQKRRQAAVEAYKQSVQAIRSAAIGTNWQDINQGTRILHGVKIRSITDTEVTFTHDEGVTKLSKEALPEAVRNRFRIELFPMLPEPPAKEGPEGLAALTTPEGGPLPPPAPQGSTGATAYTKLQVEIDAHEQRITTLNSHRNEWLSRARTYRNQASDATFKGRPSYSFNQQAMQAEQNADLTNAQIEKIRKEIVDLKKKQLEPAAVIAQ